MYAASGTQSGNLQTPSKTLGDPWKPSETLGKPSVTVGNCQKPFILIDFLHVFVTKSVKFGRTEVSIPPIDAKFQDLSIQRVVKGCFLIFGGEKSIFHSVVGWCFEEKTRFRHEIGREEVS